MLYNITSTNGSQPEGFHPESIGPERVYSEGIQAEKATQNFLIIAPVKHTLFQSGNSARPIVSIADVKEVTRSDRFHNKIVITPTEKEIAQALKLSLKYK
jgi:hypothetical protein